LFVTFEGIDRCGKSTVIQEVERHLKTLDRKVERFKDPWGKGVAGKIRETILEDDMMPVTEFLLYVAARRELTESAILPSLTRNQIVLCDRYFDSTLVYQGKIRGMEEKLGVMFNYINQLGYCGLVPDKTFLLDISSAESLKRGQSSDRLERETESKLEEMRELYLKMAHKEERIHVINGTLPLNTVVDEITSCILSS
jgi:dTMP kinase